LLDPGESQADWAKGFAVLGKRQPVRFAAGHTCGSDPPVTKFAATVMIAW